MQTGAVWVLSGAYPNEVESITEGMVTADDRITAHSYEIHPGGGSMSTTRLWMDGEEYTVSAAFSFSAPERVGPGETFEITIAAADSGTSNRDAYIQHSIQADLWVNDGGRWYPLDSMTAATETFRLSDSPPAAATMAEKTAEYTAPAKADGFSIVFSIMSGDSPGKMAIHYDYVFSESGK